MPEGEKYFVEFTVDEFETLNECLSELRKKIDYEYQSSHFIQKTEPINDPIYVAASKLKLKFAKIQNPNTKLTIRDFLNHGTYGDSN